MWGIPTAFAISFSFSFVTIIYTFLLSPWMSLTVISNCNGNKCKWMTNEGWSYREEIDSYNY